jgi:hypothetical protein
MIRAASTFDGMGVNLVEQFQPSVLAYRQVAPAARSQVCLKLS